MRGTYFLGNGAFETRDIPEHPLAPREVLIQVAACGVCGTDVHIYHGDKGSAEVIPPVVLGHELSGTVAAVGAAVKTLHVGDHVAVDPNCYCGECHYCRRGKKQLCTNLHAIGVNENGGFADFCYAPEAQCFLLDPELPLEYGAMAEPLACCLHGARHRRRCNRIADGAAGEAVRRVAGAAERAGANPPGDRLAAGRERRD